jgi:YidC/Oxa1 family membrane protein insertase
MDRTAWIVITLCVIGLVFWEIYVMRQMQLHPVARQVSPTPSSLVSSTPIPGSSPVAQLSPTPAPSVQQQFPEKVEALSNADAELHLTNRGGAIKEVVLRNHIAEGGRRVVLNSDANIPIGAILDQPNDLVLSEFTPTRSSDSSVQYETVTSDHITVRKRFSFMPSTEKKDNYIIAMDVDLVNGGAQKYSRNGYFVTLGSAQPLHPRDYPYFTRLVWCIGGRAKGVDVSWFGGSGGFLGSGLGARAPHPFYDEHFGGGEWAAVSDQFFATLIAPLTAKAAGVWGRRFDVARWQEQKVFGIEGALAMPAFQIEPGQTYNAKFQIWAGPKIYHRLARLEHNEAEVMDFGMFKIVCQFLLNFMNLLHSWLHDYGLAILALTTVIKLTLWPIQNKANKSMRQMAVLSPKMQELREKYKDDPTRMNQEVMKLYKQYGINPVGGCLPMMIQIPIFFGLFKMLGQAVELRNAKFLWIKDLSQPDTLAYLPVLGWRINLIPILMAASQIWLMAMTPKTGDQTQRRVMMFTPLIFLFICYNFAAALALYYTTQNLFSILQFYINKRQPMPTLEKVAPAGKRK